MQRFTSLMKICSLCLLVNQVNCTLVVLVWREAIFDELTIDKFIFNPFSSEPGSRLYKTGDLARYLSDGNIEFIGRIDYQVKIRGFRIELGEIEAILDQHPALTQTLVIAREDINGDKQLVAYVVANAEQIPSRVELHHFLQSQLPEYMVPAYFCIFGHLTIKP